MSRLDYRYTGVYAIHKALRRRLYRQLVLVVVLLLLAIVMGFVALVGVF